MFKRALILRSISTLMPTQAVPFIVLLSVALAIPTVANVIYVPGGYPTIQAGLDAASSSDTVSVASGTYPENITWPETDSIMLVSEAGAESTIIDGGGLGTVITMSVELDSATVIDGFTIQNGKAQSGSGILCLGASPLIKNNIIRGDTASYRGGGIYCDINSSPIIRNNQIYNNKGEWGGGICSTDTSRKTMIFANVIRGNSASGGGGIWCYNPGIIANRITENYGGLGGGIGCEWGPGAIIKDNWITENNAGEGGGIFCQGGSPLDPPMIISNIIANNSATLGGAIELWLSCPEIIGNTITGNVSPYNPMGGIYNYFSPAIISNNALLDNWCAVYLQATATIRENNIYFNTYQPNDRELRNYTANIIDAENNWWRVTDSLAIDFLIYDDDENSAYGAVDFIPYLLSANPDAPGEPSVVNRVVLKADSSYTDDLIGEVEIGDTLYIQLEGNTWNDSLVDPALVIITSDADPYGIGTALIETAESTGVYRGRAFVDTISSDAYNRIGADASDMIIISSNVYPVKSDTVIVNPVYVQEDVLDGSLPQMFGLSQNYPNPFNPITEFKYALPKDCHVRLEIHNILGQRVATLVNGKQKVGYKAARWDASPFASGIYFYRLQAGDFTQTRKMILLK